MADEIPANLVRLASNAMQTEHREAGPGDVGPSVNPTDPQQQAAPGQNPLVTLDFDEDLLKTFWDLIDQSDQRVNLVAEQWDILLDDYRPLVLKGAQKIKNNGHFRNVHTKLGSLFYRVPDLILEPDDPGPANNEMHNQMNAQLRPGVPPMPPLKLEDIISVKQAVLKKKMGRDGIKGGRLMDELLFDALAWAGIGCCKVAYQCVHKTIHQPKLGPPPNAMPPPQQSPLGPSPQRQPRMLPTIEAIG